MGISTQELYLDASRSSCVLQVQAGGGMLRRGLAASSAPQTAPGPSQGAKKDVRVVSSSGFAATVVAGASGLADKVIDRTQGFASAAQTIVDTLTTRSKAPIILMHGAIQGGWVWDFPRISNGAPLVSPHQPTLIHTTKPFRRSWWRALPGA